MTVAELEARMTPRELAQWDEWLLMKAESSSGSPGPMSQRQQTQQRIGGG